MFPNQFRSAGFLGEDDDEGEGEGSGTGYDDDDDDDDGDAPQEMVSYVNVAPPESVADEQRLGQELVSAGIGRRDTALAAQMGTAACELCRVAGTDLNPESETTRRLEEFWRSNRNRLYPKELARRYSIRYNHEAVEKNKRFHHAGRNTRILRLKDVLPCEVEYHFKYHFRRSAADMLHDMIEGQMRHIERHERTKMYRQVAENGAPVGEPEIDPVQNRVREDMIKQLGVFTVMMGRLGQINGRGEGSGGVRGRPRTSAVKSNAPKVF